MLEIEEVRDPEQLAGHQGPWRELVERSPTGDIFQTWEWLSSWLECFWAGRPIRFLFVHDAGRLVGLAPLLDDPSGKVGCRGSLPLPVNEHVRRLDLVQDGDPRELLEALVRHLGKSNARFRLVLKQGRLSSPTGAALQAAAQSFGLAFTRVETLPSPIIRIDCDWPAFLATRSAHTRSELKRKSRKLERDFQPAWSIVSAPGECQRGMDDVMHIEERSWKEDAGTSFNAGDGLERFYRTVALRFAEAGWLKIYLLHLASQPVAHVFGAEFKQEYFAIKTSYDAAFRDASPGVVLIENALRDAFTRKLRAFDLLGEDSRWKRELANDSRPHANLCLYSRLDPYCACCAAHNGLLKPFIRANAPGVLAVARKVAAALRPPDEAKPGEAAVASVKPGGKIASG
ncbi:MAG: GNAT family N-acetyltransferase [Myxococcaceae bacterium]